MSQKLSCQCGSVELHVTLAQDPSEAMLCDCSFLGVALCQMWM